MDVLGQCLAAHISKSTALSGGDGFESLPSLQGYPEREAWCSLRVSCDRRATRTPGQCPFGDVCGQLLGQAAVVGKADVLTVKVDVRADRSGSDSAATAGHQDPLR